MRTLAILFSLTLNVGGCVDSNRSELIGKWRSNVAFTLASIEASSRMTDLMRSNMTGPSFGNEIWEFKRDKSRFVVIESGDGWDFATSFNDYELLEENEEYFLVKAYGVYTDLHQHKFYRDGDCFYEYFEKFDVKQYFCKT